ncbi:RNA pseudouridine synthase [Ramlibacter alkalitolerans]|uniref:Dual-specificity RNA pseudouridine synthase RluF n=1 Tax=Ramlibacter alkalitolerans TaxID=2039631 RepID=A0ABS1JH08_9BURK|nr:RNA pseudouridine synthase [Ramlibacter alkalitolerans]MBL0423508.1 RNA-binding protein [Ramlibacter alkalitolerans]
MTAPAPAHLPEEPKRLSKVVAALVPCSRREAEQYIAEGWVRVNGKVVEEPQFRVSGEKVEIDARANLQPATPATFLLHKPPGTRTEDAQALLGAATHWQGDTSGIRRVKSHAVGLAALLALPKPAEGLSVFSQDARIVRKLREDANVIEQELVAEVTGTLVPGGLSRLCAGLVFEGRPLPPARVSWQSEARLRFAVKGIAPEMVPWMCAQVGLKLTALRRLRIGRVPMAGLPPGQWRYLAAGERF